MKENNRTALADGLIRQAEGKAPQARDRAFVGLPENLSRAEGAGACGPCTPPGWIAGKLVSEFICDLPAQRTALDCFCRRVDTAGGGDGSAGAGSGVRVSAEELSRAGDAKACGPCTPLGWMAGGFVKSFIYGLSAWRTT